MIKYKYISVLKSDLNKTYWKAVQYSISLNEMNREEFNYYDSDISINIPKNNEDKIIQTKVVKNKFNLVEGEVSIIEIS